MRSRCLVVLVLLALGCSDAPSPQDSGPPSSDAPSVHEDIVRVVEVVGRDPGAGWSDSYSVGDQCYCESTFDHAIGDVEVATPIGVRTVREVCDAIGPGPGSA